VQLEVAGLYFIFFQHQAFLGRQVLLHRYAVEFLLTTLVESVAPVARVAFFPKTFQAEVGRLLLLNIAAISGAGPHWFGSHKTCPAGSARFLPIPNAADALLICPGLPRQGRHIENI